MTIKEVCRKYRVTPDTLRYYERAGMIPAVHRTKGGARDYTEEDLASVETVLCMRGAGVPVEMVARYMKLCQQGDGTIPARRDLLKEVREELVRQIDQRRRELDQLNYKIKCYEAAVETGVLDWGAFPCPKREE